MARSRFRTPLSPGGRTDPSNYWLTGKPHTQTSTCRFNRIIRFSTNLIAVIRTLLERSDSIVNPPYMWLPGKGDKEGERANEQEENY